MYGCESWTIRKAEHWRIDAFELWCWRRLLSPLDCKEIQPVHPKREQCWVFLGRTDVEAETPVLWPPDEKSWLIWKDPDPGKAWGQDENWTREDEMVGSHHWLDGYGFGWTPGVGDGQGGLVCHGSWDCRVRHDWGTELNWTDSLEELMLKLKLQYFGHCCKEWIPWKRSWCWERFQRNRSGRKELAKLKRPKFDQFQGF